MAAGLLSRPRLPIEQPAPQEPDVEAAEPQPIDDALNALRSCCVELAAKSEAVELAQANALATNDSALIEIEKWLLSEDMACMAVRMSVLAEVRRITAAASGTYAAFCEFQHEARKLAGDAIGSLRVRAWASNASMEARVAH